MNRFFCRLFHRNLATELSAGDVVWHHGSWRPVERIAVHENWAKSWYEVFLGPRIDLASDDFRLTIGVPPEHELKTHP